MSAFYCPECKEYKNPDTAGIMYPGREVICEDCYQEYLCECGEEQPNKEDMCWDCMWEASH